MWTEACERMVVVMTLIDYSLHVTDENGVPIGGATCVDGDVTVVTAADGDVYLHAWPLTPPQRQVTCRKDGYIDGYTIYSVTGQPQIIHVQLQRKSESLARPRPQNHQWFIGNTEWRWRGSSDFKLLADFVAGVNLTDRLNQRKAAGANLVRVLAMKQNNTGWQLVPSYTVETVLPAFFQALAAAGFYCDLTVFADTRAMMANQNDQLHFWARIGAVAQHHTNVFLDLLNEAGHPTQAIDPKAFQPIPGVLCSHGSGQTDAHSVDPFWQWSPYHARRDTPPDARGFTNCCPFTFESNYPKPCPQIVEESIKPEQYGYDKTFAFLMGKHAGMGCGGTFHTSAGVGSAMWNGGEQACAKAFFDGIGH